MEKNVLFIKNMVCRSCKVLVIESLDRMHIPFEKISLGEVILQRPLGADEKKKLQQELRRNGFGILTGKEERLVNAVKSLITAEIYEKESLGNKNLSEVLSSRLNYDYSHISTTFSRSEGKSIQDFQLEVRVKRIKELLEYGELSISEIARELGYSSAAYLSTQFKKITGENPSQYKLRHLKEDGRMAHPASKE